MIRLLVTDVDGTLLDSSRHVSAGNREALRRAQEAGIMVGYATGRLMPTLRPVIEEVGIPGPTVTCNGGHCESVEGEVLYQGFLEDRARDFVIAYSEEHGINANVYQPYEVFASHESPFLEMYRERTKGHPTVAGWDGLRREKATKMIYIDHPEANAVNLRHFEPFQVEYGFDLTVSEPEYLEFLPHGVNKATALKALVAHLGFEASEVAVIGDYMNDLEMIQWAGLSCAVGSGAEAVKEAADLVGPANDQDAVAWFVDKLLGRVH